MLINSSIVVALMLLTLYSTICICSYARSYKEEGIMVESQVELLEQQNTIQIETFAPPKPATKPAKRASMY